MNEIPDMSPEVARRYVRELCNQPKVTLVLKTRRVKAGVFEALLHGRRPLARNTTPKLRTVYHWVLLRIIGEQRKSPDHRMTSYIGILEITGCDSTGTTVRTRRLLWARTLIGMSGRRLPNRIVFGDSEGQGGEDGVGRRNSGSLATSGRLTWRGGA